MKRLKFPAEVIQTAEDLAVAKAFKTPSDLIFEGPKACKVVGLAPSLKCEGFLINNSAMEIPIVVFPAQGYYPFNVELIEPELLRRKSVPEGAPHGVPPAPMKLIIPPHSEILFESGINLDEYEYKGSPRANLKWTFHFWNEPKPKGTISIVLPARK